MEKQWCNECGKYTYHTSAGCSEHTFTTIITDRTSDPSIFHCQHKIAEMNGYTYCPECGKRIDR
jgi:hypothetical protein